jgi:hypothetical protein
MAGRKGTCATISETQRSDFETLVEETVQRIESGLFLPQSDIRFPQNPGTACPFSGLCLGRQDWYAAMADSQNGNTEYVIAGVYREASCDCAGARQDGLLESWQAVSVSLPPSVPADDLHTVN